MASVYAGTKGAVNSITRVLARELGPKQIPVNAIIGLATAHEFVKEGAFVFITGRQRELDGAAGHARSEKESLSVHPYLLPPYAFTTIPKHCWISRLPL